MIEQAQKEVFDRNILVFHAVGKFLRLGKRALQRLRGITLSAARYARNALDLLFQRAVKSVGVDLHAAQNTVIQPVFFRKRVSKMKRRDFGVAVFEREILRALHCLQRLLR